MSPRKDISGKRFGRLVALHWAGHKPYKGGNTQMWLARCDCGTEKEIAKESLVRGFTRSCGCAPKQLATHGHAKKNAASPEYQTWARMIQRCKRPIGKDAYAPGNCRWATATEQTRNRRNTLKDAGVTLAELSQRHGLRYHTVKDRFHRGDRGSRLTRDLSNARAALQSPPLKEPNQ